MAVTVSMLSVLTVLLFIGWKGINHFWPHSIYEWKTLQGQTLIGQIYQTQQVPWTQLSSEQKNEVPQPLRKKIEGQSLPEIERWVIKVANRDVWGGDFVSEFAYQLEDPIAEPDLVIIERNNNGFFFGRVVALQQDGLVVSKDLPNRLAQAVEQADKARDEIAHIITSEIESLSEQIRTINRQLETLHSVDSEQSDLSTSLNQQKDELNRQRTLAEVRVATLRQANHLNHLIVKDMHGDIHTISFSEILDAWYPNQLSVLDKLGHWFNKAVMFLIDEPRESNSEGGVFPAIFGTILLVLLMSVAVMPLGVLAGLYLHEYAQNNWLTRLIRITVHNLAGVPSIVYGVFGLGFFVYTLGGSIDELFYSDVLPASTFGTPGLLWASLTLAMLTMPVVVVTIEDGLSRIPNTVRDGAYALGATKSEAIFRVVLPMAMPAILTALILAIARAAGEVAPLMLVGVVKLAPNLPIDGQFPYIHLERKFMHLGFHIYDVGFQTTNLEAAKSLVYATSMLLVTVTIGLNLIAIRIRNSLRNSYRNLGFDEHVF